MRVEGAEQMERPEQRAQCKSTWTEEVEEH